MVFLQMIFAVIIERFPPDNAEISFMVVTDTVQGGNCVIEQRVISYDNVNIDDRFCRQTSHGSAADMLNTQRQFAESILKLVFDFYKILFPDLIIWQDYNMFCTHFHSPVQITVYHIPRYIGKPLLGLFFFFMYLSSSENTQPQYFCM